MNRTTLTLRNSGGQKTVALADYLEPAADERAHEAAYAWIKQLRRLDIGGLPFRDRFTARGDSLWWFTELYLHKERVVLDIHRTLSAVAALIDEERPKGISIATPSPVVGHVVAGLAARRSIEWTANAGIRWRARLARVDLRARALTLSGRLTPERWRTARPQRAAEVAAFVHRAFWRSGVEGASAESYIGPTLSELERRLGAGSVAYVGVGPTTSFAAGRPAPLSSSAAAAIIPVERLASRSALSESRTVWRRRYRDFAVLAGAEDLRAAATIGGVDCWPLVREQLAGVAWLQWPWSVRAMDEAGAALDALTPRAVVTYAEAGGWGRALVLEARRRGIASVGLQHGFIYRHWLNYRHELDEIQPTGTPPFPYPTRTLLFDEYAARHLREQGRLPAEALQVTGSSGLDALAQQIGSLTQAQLAQTRETLGIAANDRVLLVATKEKEARASLDTLLEAAAHQPNTVVVIKPHPAETAAAYAAHSTRTHVRVSGDLPLAPLLAISRAVATVNSTVAIDAGALGIPALSFGLPNNLSPFVDAGAMAGSPDPADLPALLSRILYDEGFRQQLADRREAIFGDRFALRAQGAAQRSADAVIELIGPGR